MPLRLLPSLALAGLLSGCASIRPSTVPNPHADEAAVCTDYLEALDRAAATAGVRDAQAARVAGYPYLRVDRFLASFPPGTLNEQQFSDWLGRLQALDQEGRRVEIANLPPAARAQVATRFAIGSNDPQSLSSRAERCSSVLRSELVDSIDLRYDLWTRATVPDDYVDWQRLLGLYPLAQIPFGLGVHNWQRDTLQGFAVPLDTVPVRGELVRYVPRATATASPATTTAQIEAWRKASPMRIPSPSPTALDGLLRTYAPILIVDTASEDDRIGTMELDGNGESRVATGDPVVYAYASHARWQGVVVLQLNYVIWFPSRPADGAFDLLGGHLDGITWRLTFSPAGEVLVADTIHNCGCYHLFFPSASLRPVAYGASQEERPFVPQALPALGEGDRYALRIESRTHYVQRVLAVTDVSGSSYELSRYDVLRSLPLTSGTRQSLFGPDGIVPGTERGERFVFWPMGVPDAGAMRQRDHHATAFVGRRHFDDPWLIERSFLPVGP